MTDRPPTRVALVEDDDALAQATAQALALEGIEVECFGTASAALAAIPPDFPGVIVSDVRLPGIDGLALFDELSQADPDLPVILITGHGDVSMAVEAMKRGAADFLTKPYSSHALVGAIEKAAEARRLKLEVRRLERALKAEAGERFLGSSPAAQQIRSTIAAVAAADVDVVVEGASGTGKSFVARLIHDLGPRRSRPFITVDAAVLAHEDADLLLFGRDPGRGLSRTGLVERANGGTLLLDDMESAGNALRSRLLATLETRSVMPIGAERARRLNLRIVATRTLGIESAPERMPFFRRLNAVRIELPPIAERREDVVELFRHFVARLESDLARKAPALSAEALFELEKGDWPGNLAELAARARAHVLGLSAGAAAVGGAEPPGSLGDRLAAFEKSVLENALREARGNVAVLERALATPRKTLYDRLARHDLRPRDFRD